MAVSPPLGAAGGTYLLLLYLPRARQIQVGRFGNFRFERGCYCYVGSALGPGGLAARLRHHARGSTRPHWHLDYLRRYASVCTALICADGVRREHEWADACAAEPGSAIPVPGMGSSDCGCVSHLFSLVSTVVFERIGKRIQAIGEEISRVDPATLKKS